MSFIQSLNLTKQDKSKNNNPLMRKKEKLIERINEQIELAQNPAFAPIHKKRLKRTDGTIAIIDAPKRIKRWWHIGLNGKVELVIRKGNKVIELAKGKDAILLENKEQLIPTLNALKKAIAEGELDSLIQ